MSNNRSAVPALPELASIGDQNTRAALQAVYDLLKVRNGDVGDPKDRFITAEEAGNAGLSVTVINGATNRQQQSRTGNSDALANVSRTIADLEDSVRASPFFNSLRGQITRIAQDGAQIEIKQEILQSSFASLSQISTKLQAQVGENLVLLQQLSSVSANMDGRLSAQWSVKIDINGYVSGFGLSSTANNSTPYSEFYIAADRFAIGSPGVPRTVSAGSLSSPTTANVPFIVVTTPFTLNGKTVPVGVYMRDAFIQNGSIVNANIGFAQVDALEIQGNAVTVPYIADQSGTLTLSLADQNLLIMNIVYGTTAVPDWSLITCTMNVLVTDPGGTATLRASLWVGGTQIADFGTRAATGLSFSPTFTKAVSSAVMGAGSYFVYLKVKLDAPAPTTFWTIQSATVSCIGARR